ncbi:helix-turn-helix transcriptional regulator [Myceligenerans sp. I2]|uniref:Helix-turn-helix transcriptional regulator n=2 Tax=Myceligenerans indicum TaxID=2593663 RepID=A0ABS1LK43_9MICO|nr:helix-turn-helix transcriptional regulator [Myceligenerans indicum]
MRKTRAIASRATGADASGNETGTGRGREMVVMRQEIGDVLRDVRQLQGRTLREVSSAARVSLGYLSEVERGQKEASSELLASICDALDVPLSRVLREVSDRVAVAEGILPQIPDTIPADFMQGMLARSDRSATKRDVAREDLAPVG